MLQVKTAKNLQCIWRMFHPFKRLSPYRSADTWISCTDENTGSDYILVYSGVDAIGAQ